jgi:hypothetical protein
VLLLYVRPAAGLLFDSIAGLQDRRAVMASSIKEATKILLEESEMPTKW